MSSAESILSEISKLDNLIYHIFEECITLRGYVSGITNEVKENMFSKGKYYPHYKSNSACRNSKYNGKRYHLNKNEEVKSYTSSLISLTQSSNLESYLIVKFS